MGDLQDWFPAFAERACATVVSSSYSAWRVPALWIPAYSGMTVMAVACRIGTMRCIVFTLTFDSSPIKGEGILSVFCLLAAPTLLLWIADQVRNDGFVVAGESPPPRLTSLR